MKVRADAEAQANKLIAESLTDALIRSNEIKAWNGELPTTWVGGNGAVPFLQIGNTAAPTAVPAE